LTARHAALSVSATVGVAIATLMVVGGILAGPAIIECSRDSNGFGACLRDKMAESGLISPDTEGIERPEIVADIPSAEPSAPETPTGWMEANANEYEPPASAFVDLTGTPADMAAAELAPVPEVPVEVAVTPPIELATGIASPEGDTGTVTLDGAELNLVAEGAPSSEAAAPADVALVGPPGEIAVTSAMPALPVDPVTALSEPKGLVAEGRGPEEAVTTVTPEPAPAELEAEAIEAPPPVAIEFNPQYPNVLVLPPPVTGDNSSFRSLQLN
jgi:hypothetical protein